MRDKLGE